jgi:hypothetical protein
VALQSTSWSADGSSDLATPIAADLDGMRLGHAGRGRHCLGEHCCASVLTSTGSLSPGYEFPLRIVGHVPARGKEVWRGHCFV